MADETSALSRSVEDYLKVIYSLCEPGEVASTSSIAETLEVQPASVTGMVKRLAESGYLEHVPYRGVQLTEAGTRAALRVLRRHRILESYLTERLGYRWEDVHQEAERLEHSASDELIERMASALENPRYDPHGAPIPTSSGEIEATDSFTLAELGPGEEA
ncbi:MAG: metal-dependent transcriptional regulator, partial [Longimicrobiales bacterium]|nr:metal-dependent transcriptional regulator [Longimicrobiales bacterium]